MINIRETNKIECCGCRACEATCPAGCISMELDQELFYYPKVDVLRCIECGNCTKICPMINLLEKNKLPQEVYVAWSKDEEIRRNKPCPL